MGASGCCTSRSCMKCFRCISPIVTILAIGWTFYTYAIYLCIFTVQNTVEKVIYMVIFYPLFIMMLWSFVKTATTKPLAIPAKYRVDADRLEKWRILDTASVQAEQQWLVTSLSINCRTSSLKCRFCETCKCMKPDRTHHCSKCDVCVPRFDHHCPWVNNCVSWTNYKFFLLFNFYTTFTGLFTFATSLQYVIDFFRAWVSGKNYHAADVQIVVLCIFVFFVIIFICLLYFFHLRILFMNLTSIEWTSAPVFYFGPSYKAFDRGAYENFKQTFGDNKWLWLIPVFSGLGNGVEYDIDPTTYHVPYRSNQRTYPIDTPPVDVQPVLVQPPVQRFRVGDDGTTSNDTTPLKNTFD